MRHPSTAIGFDWDDANVDKLAKRGVRPDEVEAVWGNRPQWFRNRKTGTATWMMVGNDPRSGRRLRVGIVWADEEERILRAFHVLEG